MKKLLLRTLEDLELEVNCVKRCVIKVGGMGKIVTVRNSPAEVSYRVQNGDCQEPNDFGRGREENQVGIEEIEKIENCLQIIWQLHGN